MSEPTPSLTLAVNDRVVYPNQGVCRVSGIDTKEIAGQKLVFVTLKREEDGAVVMVPQAKLTAIGVRKVATKQDIQNVFDFLKSESDKADLDWKQRARTNVERMAQGGILGLAEVVKGLQVLSELRPLPTKERELYDNARHLLVYELAASLSCSECDAEDSIDLALSPPGKERPKRTAEEFKRPGEEGDEHLDLADDLLAMGGDLDLPSDEPEPAPEEEEHHEESEDEAAPVAKKGAGKTAAKATKPAAIKISAPAAAKSRLSLSDDEPTEAMGQAFPETKETALKRGRGRPPKPKPAVDPSTPVPEPKPRGRPPKSKAAPVAVAPPDPPKKRGRPPAGGKKK